MLILWRIVEGKIYLQIKGIQEPHGVKIISRKRDQQEMKSKSVAIYVEKQKGVVSLGENYEKIAIPFDEGTGNKDPDDLLKSKQTDLTVDGHIDQIPSNSGGKGN